MGDKKHNGKKGKNRGGLGTRKEKGRTIGEYEAREGIQKLGIHGAVSRRSLGCSDA
jgi:hypothetical protein